MLIFDLALLLLWSGDMRTHLISRWTALLLCILVSATLFGIGCGGGSGAAAPSPSSTLIPIELPTNYSFSKHLTIDVGEFTAVQNATAASSIVMGHVDSANAHLDAILDITSQILIPADAATEIAMGELADGTDWIVDFRPYAFALDNTTLDIDTSAQCSGNAAEYPVCARYYVNGRRVMLTYLEQPVSGESQGRGGFRLVSTNTTGTSVEELLSGQEDFLFSGVFDLTQPAHRQVELIWGSITPDTAGAVITSARAVMAEVVDDVGSQVEANTNISVLENGDAGTAAGRVSWRRDDQCFYATELELTGSQGDATIFDEELAFGTDDDVTCDTLADFETVPDTIVDGASAEDLGISQALTAPTLVSSTPQDGASSVALNSAIILTFSEPVQSATIDDTSVQRTPAIPGTLSVNDHIVTFVPDDDLAPETQYSITLTTDIADLDGLSLPVETVVTFQSAALTAEPADEADLSAPLLLSTSPSTDANDVSRNSVISAAFNETLDAESVTISSFTLDDGTETVDAAVSSADDTAQLTPNAPLTLLQSYTATLSTAITDAAGNAFAAEQNWSFTTGDGSWQPSTLSASLSGSSVSPMHVEQDSAGNTIAVLSYYDGAASSLYAQHYSVATQSWGDPRAIESSAATSSRSTLYVFPNGDAWAAWSHLSGGFFRSVYYNTYDAGTDTWAGAQFLTNTTHNITSMHILPRHDGDIMLRWMTDDADTMTMFQNIFDTGTETWTGETSALIGEAVFNMHCATNASLDSACAWAEWDGSRYDMHVNYYNADTQAWAEAIDIDGTESGHVAPGQIAIDNNSIITVAWQEQSSGTYITRARRFDINGAYDSGVVSLENDTSNDTTHIRVASDDNGNAIAIWRKNDAGQESLWGSRFDSASSLWSDAALLETDDTNAVSNPAIAMDDNGNAIAAWNQGGDLYSSRYVESSDSWGTAELAESHDDATTTQSQLLLRPDGSGTALYSVAEDDTNLYRSEFQ